MWGDAVVPVLSTQNMPCRLAAAFSLPETLASEEELQRLRPEMRFKNSLMFCDIKNVSKT